MILCISIYWMQHAELRNSQGLLWGFSRSDKGEIKNIPLGDNPPSDYIIQIIAFKNRQVAAIFHIQVTGKERLPCSPCHFPPWSFSPDYSTPPTLSLTVGETSQVILPKTEPKNASNQVILIAERSRTRRTVLPGNKIWPMPRERSRLPRRSCSPRIPMRLLSLSIAPAAGNAACAIHSDLQAQSNSNPGSVRKHSRLLSIRTAQTNASHGHPEISKSPQYRMAMLRPSPREKPGSKPMHLGYIRVFPTPYPWRLSSRTDRLGSDLAHQNPILREWRWPEDRFRHLPRRQQRAVRIG